MKISVEGTEKEIEIVKSSLGAVCLFNGKFCATNKRCGECEKEQNLKIEYVIKNS